MQFNCIPFQELNLDQLYAIMQLRQEVFVVEQNCPYLDADGLDQGSLHLMGYKHNVLVAYARLVPKGLTYEKYASFGRVITAQSVRGKGLGKELVMAAIQHLHLNFGIQTIKISAQSHLINFYHGCGFLATGEEYLEDGIPHTAMLLI